MTKQTLNQIKTKSLTQIKLSGDPPHDLTHAKKVHKNSLKIIKILGLTPKEVDLNLLTALCFLHDLVYAQHPANIVTYFNEGKLAKKEAQKILETVSVDPQEKSVALDAMLHHVHSFPFKNLKAKNSLYTKILQDADTLEFFSPRRVRLFRSQQQYDLVYKIAQKTAPFFIKYGRKNIKKYLNFPQISKLINA